MTRIRIPPFNKDKMTVELIGDANPVFKSGKGDLGDSGFNGCHGWLGANVEVAA